MGSSRTAHDNRCDNGQEGRPDVLIEGSTGVTWFLGALASTFAGKPFAAVDTPPPEVQMILDHG
jgi:hypothetical protein